MIIRDVNRRVLDRYLRRVDDPCPLDAADPCGAQEDDANGARPQRERGTEWVVVLVSGAFDGVPWLERVYQAGALWDGAEMRHPADVHCYTPAEFERKKASLPVVRRVAATGLQLLPAPA